MTGRDDDVSGRRADDGNWQAIEARIDGLEREMRSRFQHMEDLLNQRIRHGDQQTATTVAMLSDLVTKLQATDEHQDKRIRALEDQQTSWRSNLRLVGGMMVGSSGIGGIAGTIIGLTVGG